MSRLIRNYLDFETEINNNLTEKQTEDIFYAIENLKEILNRNWCKLKKLQIQKKSKK